MSKDNDTRMSKGGRPSVFDNQEILKLYADGLTQSEVARRVGCTQSNVAKVLHKAGIRTLGKRGPNPNAKQQAQQVIDYITTSGGTLRNALLTLDLEVCDATVRSLAKQLGIDIYDYRYFKVKRRNWLVHKPGYKPKSVDGTVMVPAQCTHCGHETELYYYEFNKARPRVCPECGAN